MLAPVSCAFCICDSPQSRQSRVPLVLQCRVYSLVLALTPLRAMRRRDVYSPAIGKRLFALITGIYVVMPTKNVDQVVTRGGFEYSNVQQVGSTAKVVNCDCFGGCTYRHGGYLADTNGIGHDFSMAAVLYLT